MESDFKGEVARAAIAYCDADEKRCGFTPSR